MECFAAADNQKQHRGPVCDNDGRVCGDIFDRTGGEIVSTDVAADAGSPGASEYGDGDDRGSQIDQRGIILPIRSSLFNTKTNARISAAGS